MGLTPFLAASIVISRTTRWRRSRRVGGVRRSGPGPSGPARGCRDVKRPHEGMSSRIREDEPVVTSILRGVTRRRSGEISTREEAGRHAGRGRMGYTLERNKDRNFARAGRKVGAVDWTRDMRFEAVSAGRALRWLPMKLQDSTGFLGRKNEASEVAVEVRQTVGLSAPRARGQSARCASSARSPRSIARRIGNEPQGRGASAKQSDRSQMEESVRGVETPKAQTAGAGVPARVAAKGESPRACSAGAVCDRRRRRGTKPHGRRPYTLDARAAIRARWMSAGRLRAIR
jgi:hypothetical protein